MQKQKLRPDFYDRFFIFMVIYHKRCCSAAGNPLHYGWLPPNLEGSTGWGRKICTFLLVHWLKKVLILSAWLTSMAWQRNALLSKLCRWQFSTMNPLSWFLLLPIAVFSVNRFKERLYWQYVIVSKCKVAKEKGREKDINAWICILCHAREKSKVMEHLKRFPFSGKRERDLLWIDLESPLFPEDVAMAVLDVGWKEGWSLLARRKEWRRNGPKGGKRKKKRRKETRRKKKVRKGTSQSTFIGLTDWASKEREKRTWQTMKNLPLSPSLLFSYPLTHLSASGRPVRVCLSVCLCRL